jgi:NhaP-type Na+/H+ or K+/H+ antiporter
VCGGFSVIALLAGLLFSPLVLNFVRPLDYAGEDPEALASITLNFTRLVLGIQLFIAGIQLPRKYLWTEWKSLALLLGPVMTSMWICTSLIVWALVPNLPILHAMAVGACVTPTDPVLSSSIVKGKFADKNIPKQLQKIIIAESGANDGLGYPFLFLALYLIRYTVSDGQNKPGGAADAMALWFGETWGYIVILSVVYGAAVGWIANKALHRAEEKWASFPPALFNSNTNFGVR